MVGKLYLRMNKNVVMYCLRFGRLFFVLCGMHKTVSVFFTVSSLLFSRHVAPSRIIVSRHRLLSYLRQMRGFPLCHPTRRISRRTCATRVCLCAVNSSCPLRHSFGGSARTGAAAVFGVNARCVVPGIHRYGALRCRGYSPIWRAALSRTFADMAHYVAPHVAVIRRGIDGRTSVY